MCVCVCVCVCVLQELESFKTPGPGAYQPENSAMCFQGEKRSPIYSMGSRSRYRKSKPLLVKTIIIDLTCSLSLYDLLPPSGDSNPSPNSYTLPALLGDRVPNKPSSACYSMAKRLKTGDFATDYAKTPGPARYEAISADVTRPRRPVYSMQARQFMPGGKGEGHTYTHTQYI